MKKKYDNQIGDLQASKETTIQQLKRKLEEMRRDYDGIVASLKEENKQLNLRLLENQETAKKIH
jgi:hypothetical protein